jgi:hypothetical protein
MGREAPRPVIGDFRQWKDHDAYQKSFQRMLRDLTINNPAERYRELARGLQKRKADEDALFQKNLTASFTLQTFAWSQISFFEDSEYRFSPTGPQGPRASIRVGSRPLGQREVVPGVCRLATGASARA